MDFDDDSEPGDHQGLVISSTPQGWFVYWKGMKPSELHKSHSRLVACLHKLPFQEGRPLSTIQEDSLATTLLVDYSLDTLSTDRNVFMTSIGHEVVVSDRYNDELSDAVSADEGIAEAAGKTEAQRDARR